MTRHFCKVRYCSDEINPQMQFMCPKHFRTVPQELRATSLAGDVSAKAQALQAAFEADGMLKNAVTCGFGDPKWLMYEPPLVVTEDMLGDPLAQPYTIHTYLEMRVFPSGNSQTFSIFEREPTEQEKAENFSKFSALILPNDLIAKFDQENSQ